MAYSMQRGRGTFPAQNAYEITPDDDADLDVPTRAIYVGGDGDVAVIMIGDSDPVTFSGCVAGSVLPIAVSRVLYTGTTATNQRALY